MNTIWSEKADTVLRVGFFLDEIGVSNWALTKSQSLLVVEKFLELKIPILGGDVYEMIDGSIQPTYDNWYCEALPEEKQSYFLVRSISTTKAYIENYKTPYPECVFFAFVPDV